MGIAHTKLTTQGQVSVPAEIRRRLAVGPGSVLEWREENGQVIVARAGKYSSMDLHKALFKTKPKRRSLAELKAGVAAFIQEKHARR